MATSALQGYLGVIKLSTAAGQTPASLAEVRDFSLLIEADEIDATIHESSGDEESIIGKITWSGTAQTLHVQGAASQQALFDCLVNRTKVDFEFYPHGESGGYGYLYGSGYIDGWELASPTADALATNIGLIGTETLGMYAGPYYPSVSSGLMFLQSTDTNLRFAVSSGLAFVSSSGTYVAVIQHLNDSSAGEMALIST